METLEEISRKYPGWIIPPIGRCIKFVAEEAVTAGLITRALISIEGLPVILQLARQRVEQLNAQHAANFSFEPWDHLLQMATDQLPLAAEHIKADFATINSHSLIASWSAVETCIEDTVTLILMNDSEGLGRLLASTKLRIHGDSTESRTEFDFRLLYRRWERQLRRDRSAVDCMLTMLNFFSIRATLPPEHLATLAEINSIRNSLLHRSGAIDAPAVREAPTLAPRLGEEVKVTRSDYLRYYDSISLLVNSILTAIISSPFVKKQD